MSNKVDSVDYWDDLLKSEWFWNFEDYLDDEKENINNKVSWIIEEIDEVEDSIDIYDEDWIIKFSLDWILIWIIEYSNAKNNEIYIDMIWNINADTEDFDKYDLKERYDFEKKDIQIKWLIYFMYKTFFNKLKNEWYKVVFWSIENNNLYYVNDELVNRWIIKKSYTRKNKYNKEELVREF